MLDRALFCVLLVGLTCQLCRGAPQDKNRISNLKDSTNIANEFLMEMETRGTNLTIDQAEAEWNYYHDLRPSNKAALVLATTLVKEFTLSASKNASQIREPDLSGDIRRKLMLIRRNADPKSQKDLAMLESLHANMTETYSKGKVCKTSKTANTCLELEPGLTDVMAKSRDYDELLWAWKGWRDSVGPPVRRKFEKFVNLLNRGASQHDWGDYGHYMRSEYQLGNELKSVLKKLWENVRPLYEELHAYVRFKLKKEYPQISGDGPIPAHILGNMWAQDWSTIFDIVKPYPNSPSLNVTENLKAQNYTPVKMFELAQSFFVSLGLDKMPDSFWKKSMITKPANKSVVCHASAWAFRGDDVRISMCSHVTHEDLITIHHELGHCEYDLAYRNLSYAFRAGGNPGFHEAIGDTIALSVETPAYLKKVGLLDKLPQGEEATINFLMMQALRRVAPLPFTYLVDQWRWKVFLEKGSSTNYNSEWWKLRKRFQGVEAPVRRDETDFDPGAKFHIVANSPYIGYFVSLVHQFQFHRALCRIAKQPSPLYNCSIYNSTEAGEKFREMLKTGRSEPWPKTLYRLTGERELSMDALLEYFKPLQHWLSMYRKKNDYKLGWKKNVKKQATSTADGVKKTLSSTKSDTSKKTLQPGHGKTNSTNSKQKGKGVSFPKAKLSNEGLNLKPDLKTALEAMQPNAKKPEPSKLKEGELDAKSIILGARPMFVPNTVKDQIELGNKLKDKAKQ